MSWFRIEGTLPQHVKYAPLSDSAFRLAITAGCWCSHNLTDGRIPKGIVPTLTSVPRGRALADAIKSLVAAKIWTESESGYVVHDFLDWNMSRAAWEAKVAAARAGGNAKAAKVKNISSAKSLPRGKPSGIPKASQVACQKPAISPAKALPDSDSDSSSLRSEENKTPYSQLVDWYFAEFERARGQRPSFGSREGKSVRELLASLNGDIERAKSLIANAMTDSFWGQKATINDIAREPAKFMRSQSQANQQKQSAVGKIEINDQGHVRYPGETNWTRRLGGLPPDWLPAPGTTRFVDALPPRTA